MFLHREAELERLHTLFKKDKMTGFVYGKRRVGKTTMIYEALKSFDGLLIDYECLKTSMDGNAKGFEDRVKKVLKNPYLSFPRFEDAFAYLSTLPDKIMVFIDEYSYLKVFEAFKGETDSRFQNIVDHLGSHLSLILSGSYVGMMKDTLDGKNPLYGRFDFIAHLLDFPYDEAADFHPERDYLSQIDTYLVFGGGALANRAILPGASLKENISASLLENDASVRNYCDSLVLDELRSKEPAEQILAALGNGKKKYSELESALRMERTGYLAKLLAPLLDMGIVTKTAPINQKDNPRCTFYEISDNLLRFYYTYVYGQGNLIAKLGTNAFFASYIEPSLRDYLSRRFESLSQSYLSRLAQRGDLPGVLDIGRYCYDDPLHHVNGEFDAAVEYKDGYDLFEVKYLKDPLDKTLLNKELATMKAVPIAGKVKRYGFFSLRGFSYQRDDVLLISGADFYRK